VARADRFRSAGRSIDRFGWSALRYRPFQLFLVAMFTANVGGFIYIAALGWFVLGLTGSAGAVGLAYAANGIPQLLLQIHAGVFTDRVGARTMVAIGIGSAGAAMVLGGVVAALPDPSFALIVVVAALAGTGYALGGPGSLSIVSELVPPDAMSSSVALNWLQLNVARVAGGVIAGAALALGSPSVALVVAGVLNAAPALLVLALRLRSDAGARTTVPASSLLRPVVEALAYTRRFPTLAVIVLLAAAPGAIGLAYIYLLPTAAAELGIGAEGLGNLIAATGVGGLIAGLFLESLQRRWGPRPSRLPGPRDGGRRAGAVRLRLDAASGLHGLAVRGRGLRDVRSGNRHPDPGARAGAAARPAGRPVRDAVLGPAADRLDRGRRHRGGVEWTHRDAPDRGCPRHRRNGGSARTAAGADAEG
jgi:MFS family permease